MRKNIFVRVPKTEAADEKKVPNSVREVRGRGRSSFAKALRRTGGEGGEVGGGSNGFEKKASQNFQVSMWKAGRNIPGRIFLVVKFLEPPESERNGWIWISILESTLLKYTRHTSGICKNQGTNSNQFSGR